MNHATLTVREWNDHGAQVTTDPDAAKKRVVDGHGVRWLDIVAENPSQLEPLVQELGLDPEIVEYTFTPLERPKLGFHQGTLLFVAYGTLGDPHNARIVGCVTGNLVVTVRKDERLDVAAMAEEIEGAVEPHHIVYIVLDAIVDTHFAAIQSLDARTDDLEAQLFDEDIPPANFTKETYLLRKELTQLRRVILPMREVAMGLARHRITDHKDPWFLDLEDHVLRVVEWSESLRDVLSNLTEMQLQLQDQHTNVIMKKLASWAAIIAVPTLVTGWFGQNIPFPGFGHVSGLWFSVVLIVVPAISMWLLLRKIDWL